MNLLNTKVLFPLVALLFCVAFVSCSDDDDVQDNSGACQDSLSAVNLDTYTGILNFTSPSGDVIANAIDGEATIQESGGAYTISFSDGVPSIDNVCFNEVDGDFISISNGSSQSGVSIEADGELALALTTDGATWVFNGDR